MGGKTADPTCQLVPGMSYRNGKENEKLTVRFRFEVDCRFIDSKRAVKERALLDWS